MAIAYTLPQLFTLFAIFYDQPVVLGGRTTGVPFRAEASTLPAMSEKSLPPELPDEEFISRLTRSQSALQVFIMGLTRSRGDTDDVLQEVNLALWRKREQYRPDEEFLPWAVGFAVLQIRKFRSSSADRRLRLDEATLEALVADFPRESTFAEDRQEALRTCLEKLRGRERTIIVDFYTSGAAAIDLSRKYTLPVNSVYKTLTRARNSLRSCVERTLKQREISSPPS